MGSCGGHDYLSPSPRPTPSLGLMPEGRSGGKGMPGLPGARLLPGLGSLDQTQPVWAGLGLGHALPSPASTTETAATLGHTNTPEVPDLCLPPIPWAVWLLLICLHRPPELPTKHTDAQSRCCWSLLFRAVTEVAARSQVVTSHRSELASAAGLLSSTRGHPVLRGASSRRPLSDGWSSCKAAA